MSNNTRPNIVLVTVDSLQAGHCGFMGYDRDTTPTLDRMAAEGLVFDQAIAPGTGTPDSMPAIFTGEFPIGGDSRNTDRGMEDNAIEAHMSARDTIPERLSRLGYQTAAFTPNPWTSRYFGFDIGFDYFIDFFEADLTIPLFERMFDGQGIPGMSEFRLLMSWIQRENTFKPWEAFYSDITDWIDGADRPYFVWIFLLDVHFPYLASSKHRSQTLWHVFHSNLQLYLNEQDTGHDPKTQQRLVRAYDDALRYTDDFFDNLLSDVDTDNTIVVVHSDHGEGLGEHDTYGHQDVMYEELIHVPLLVYGNDITGQYSPPTSLVDLPDVLTAIGQGQSPIPERDTPTVAVSPWYDLSALRGTRWKFVRDDGANTDLLFDLETDPDEESDVIGESPSLRDTFSDRLRSIRRGEDELRAVNRAINQTLREGRL